MPDFESAWATAEAEMLGRLDLLRRTPYAGLAELPPWESRDIDVGGVAIVVTTYRVSLDDGALKIVVQASMDRRRFLFGRLGRLTAQGFLRDGAGGTRDMQEKELYDYV